MIKRLLLIIALIVSGQAYAMQEDSKANKLKIIASDGAFWLTHQDLESAQLRSDLIKDLTGEEWSASALDELTIDLNEIIPDAKMYDVLVVLFPEKIRAEKKDINVALHKRLYDHFQRIHQLHALPSDMQPISNAHVQHSVINIAEKHSFLTMPMMAAILQKHKNVCVNARRNYIFSLAGLEKLVKPLSETDKSDKKISSLDLTDNMISELDANDFKDAHDMNIRLDHNPISSIKHFSHFNKKPWQLKLFLSNTELSQADQQTVKRYFEQYNFSLLMHSIKEELHHIKNLESYQLMREYYSFMTGSATKEDLSSFVKGRAYDVVCSHRFCFDLTLLNFLGQSLIDKLKGNNNSFLSDYFKLSIRYLQFHLAYAVFGHYTLLCFEDWSTLKSMLERIRDKYNEQKNYVCINS